MPQHTAAMAPGLCLAAGTTKMRESGPASVWERITEPSAEAFLPTAMMVQPSSSEASGRAASETMKTRTNRRQRMIFFMGVF